MRVRHRHRQAVDLATLLDWPLPAHATTGKPVAIAAVDAELDSLLVLLVPKSLPLVARATGIRVSGRIAAPSREAA
jgi:hypothetical protein